MPVSTMRIVAVFLPQSKNNRIGSTTTMEQRCHRSAKGRHVSIPSKSIYGRWVSLCCVRVRSVKRKICNDEVMLTFWNQLTGHWIPELMDIISPMLNEKPVCRPPANNILQTFNKIVASLGDRLGPECLNF